MNVCISVCVLADGNAAVVVCVCVCGQIAQIHVVLLDLSGLFGLDTVDLVVWIWFVDGARSSLSS